MKPSGNHHVTRTERHIDWLLEGDSITLIRQVQFARPLLMEFSRESEAYLTGVSWEQKSPFRWGLRYNFKGNDFEIDLNLSEIYKSLDSVTQHNFSVKTKYNPN